MPRSVWIALLTSGVFTALGLAATLTFVLDVSGDGAASRWLGATLRVPDANVRVLFNPLYLQAAIVPPVVLRRRERARALVVQITLLVALLFGFVAIAVAIVSAVQRRLDASAAAGLLVFALATLLAWSLSRPSAKAWFASSAPPS